MLWVIVLQRARCALVVQRTRSDAEPVCVWVEGVVKGSKLTVLAAQTLQAATAFVVTGSLNGLD